MQTIDVLFIPRESLEDTNKLILEYGGTPLECVTLIKAPYVERENGPGVWMKALQDNNYTWIFHGSAGRGHVNVPRDLKGSPFWNEQADVVVQKLQASFPANAGLRFCPTKTLKRQMCGGTPCSCPRCSTQRSAPSTRSLSTRPSPR